MCDYYFLRMDGCYLRQNKLIIILLSITVFLTAIPVLQAEADETCSIYSDVSSKHYACKEIGYLTQLQLISGEENQEFRPDEPVTRGTTAIWLSKALKLGDPKSLRGFEDVAESSKYARAVNALKEQSIVQGNEGRFEPDSLLTREQMASLLSRAFQLNDNGIDAWFKDKNFIGEAHYKDVIRLKQNFLTDQLEYLPKDHVTRAQLVLFIHRAIMLGKFQGSDLQIEDFMKLPEKSGFQVSPDGKRLAYLAPWNNKLNIVVKNLQDQKEMKLTYSEQGISHFVWINNETILYIIDDNGNEDYHLYSVQSDGRGNKALTPFPNTRVELIDSLDHLPEYKNNVLIGMNNRDPKVFDLYRLNFITGDLQLVEENPGNIDAWITDNNGEVRAAIAIEGVEQILLYRESQDDEFVPVLKTNFKDSFIPIMFTFDDKQMYAASNIGRDKLALVVFDPVSRKVTETLYENDKADVSDIYVSYQKQAILAVQYETDKIQTHYMDKEFEALNQKIQGHTNLPYRILGNPLHPSRILLRTFSDTTPGAYYFYYRKEDKLVKIADLAAHLDPGKMSAMKPISYRARDGLTIHGYLTLPAQWEHKKLPVVVIPHGGPRARDSWRFDPEVQLLAYHGYAVLQVNFRGSTGYGKAFLNAGNKQWGKAMQNDLSDGVQWLIKEGIADPQRIAIYGASYGGYAALAGAAFTPELYSAAVSYIGPTSLFTLLETMPAYWEPYREQQYELIGHPISDKKLLEEASPLLHADQIRIPVMFAQGANDPRVRKSESDQMVSALRQRDIDSLYMIKNDEGHGFRSFENRVDFYTALMKFLDKNVKEKK
jgi:dipeptidyl aminopeptidase/acylaminoacyl peptidase